MNKLALHLIANISCLSNLNQNVKINLNDSISYKLKNPLLTFTALNSLTLMCLKDLHFPDNPAPLFSKCWLPCTDKTDIVALFKYFKTCLVVK